MSERNDVRTQMKLLTGAWKHAATPAVAWLHITIAGPARWL
jgi:hypothetical protein